MQNSRSLKEAFDLNMWLCSQLFCSYITEFSYRLTFYSDLFEQWFCKWSHSTRVTHHWTNRTKRTGTVWTLSLTTTWMHMFRALLLHMHWFNTFFFFNWELSVSSCSFTYGNDTPVSLSYIYIWTSSYLICYFISLIQKHFFFLFPAWCHLWVEFVVGCNPCSEGFSPGSPVFLPPQKWTFQIPIRSGISGRRACSWDMPLQIPIYFILFILFI